MSRAARDVAGVAQAGDTGNPMMLTTDEMRPLIPKPRLEGVFRFPVEDLPLLSDAGDRQEEEEFEFCPWASMISRAPG